MLGIDRKRELYIEIRKTERLLQITRHPEKRKKLEYKLQKLYTQLNEILWDEKQEKSIELPAEVLEES